MTGMIGPLAGAFELECLADNISMDARKSLSLPIALPAALVGGLLLILGILFVVYYRDILYQLELRRNSRLKIRYRRLISAVMAHAHCGSAAPV